MLVAGCAIHLILRGHVKDGGFARQQHHSAAGNLALSGKHWGVHHVHLYTLLSEGARHPLCTHVAHVASHIVLREGIRVGRGLYAH